MKNYHINKNETELEKMKRESLEWIERYGKSAPTFISIAVNAFPSQIASKEKEYDIDFGGHCKTGINIKNNIPRIIGAINGWGDGISNNDIIITEKHERKTI